MAVDALFANRSLALAHWDVEGSELEARLDASRDLEHTPSRELEHAPSRKLEPEQAPRGLEVLESAQRTIARDRPLFTVEAYPRTKGERSARARARGSRDTYGTLEGHAMLR